MRWEDQRESRNVEDRRGRVPGGRGMAIGGTGIIIVLLVSWLTGQNPLHLLSQMGGLEDPSSPTTQSGTDGTPQDHLGKFASVVLADTEQTWHEILPAMGIRYQEPRLVLFSGGVQSACGMSSAAVGPFYCPLDQRVYLDLSFFDEMSRRFGAPGDFASAYVIAHEVGHHVQNLLGIAGKVRQAQQSLPKEEANQLSVRMELQADCLAGVWGYHADRRQLIEPGDFEEGLGAAAAIGDDRLQNLSAGEIQPEAWTHGSSEQRSRWLRKGLQSGDPKVCDTFSGAV